jgi:hypothetical protein
LMVARTHLKQLHVRFLNGKSLGMRCHEPHALRKEGVQLSIFKHYDGQPAQQLKESESEPNRFIVLKSAAPIAAAGRPHLPQILLCQRVAARAGSGGALPPDALLQAALQHAHSIANGACGAKAGAALSRGRQGCGVCEDNFCGGRRRCGSGAKIERAGPGEGRGTGAWWRGEVQDVSGGWGTCEGSKQTTG